MRRAFGPPGALEIDRTAGALEGALGQAATVWGLPSAAAGALGSHPVCLDPVCLHSVCLNAVCLDPVRLDPVRLDPVCVGRSCAEIKQSFKAVLTQLYVATCARRREVNRLIEYTSQRHTNIRVCHGIDPLNNNLLYA